MGMTMTEVETKLLADYKEEIQDCNNYYAMAEMADMYGHEELAAGLYEISKDEFTHAKFIREHVVMSMHEAAKDSSSMEWEALCRKMEPLFR